MSDPLYDLLLLPHPSSTAAPVVDYLNHLASLSLSALTSTEPAALHQSSASLLRSLQSLSKRSHKAIVATSDHLSNLQSVLPEVARDAEELRDALPGVEDAAGQFVQKYSRSTENTVLDRRRKAMLLSRNVDRVSDILDLPTLLSSAISSSAASGTTDTTSSSATSTTNYAAALDLHAHIRRLQTLFPSLSITQSISAQAEAEILTLTTNLITSLQSQNIKLAAAMRTIGWLRRVAPELDESRSLPKAAGVGKGVVGSGDGTLGSVFLVCRLANLVRMLEALSPLRDLADQETAARLTSIKPTPQKKGIAADRWATSTTTNQGQQTERYLKRYIEIFREQSFAIISTYKSIFPSALPTAFPTESVTTDHNPLLPLPSPLTTFPLHLVALLTDTLRAYLPNMSDRGGKDSLMTQVLYCAGSLGRLGAEFGMVLSLLAEGDGDDDEGDAVDDEGDGVDDEEDWAEVMKKQRVQASRLELLASGVAAGGGSRKASVAV
ncbi:hypothetical protein LTR04_003389 [Oleoguttula sp. CCFEE 6159]|nr:hypothetical protein LTR04_003389 [Oleoguttula sp. CCFEE 6159]